MYLGPYGAGSFGYACACLLTSQVWANQIFYDNFELKIENDFGSVLCKKLLWTKNWPSRYRLR